jgi:hypothetical protein
MLNYITAYVLLKQVFRKVAGSMPDEVIFF